MTKVAVRGLTSAELLVSDIMTSQTKLITATPSQSVIDAMELMMVNNFRHLPVVGGCRSCSRVCRVGLLACKCLAGLALLSVWIRKHTWRWHRAKLCMDSVNCQTVPYRQSEGGFAFSGARWHLPGHAQHA